MYGEQQDQEDAEPEGRHAQRERAPAVERAVDPAAARERAQHRHRHADHQPDQDRRKAELQCGWQALADQRGDGLAAVQRQSKIAGHGAHKPPPVLHDHRPIEAELYVERLNLLLGGVLAQNHADRPAGHGVDHRPDRD
jgi:hypothetical protein